MSAAQSVERESRSAAARSFVRSLNILLRCVRLYGITHKLTTAQFQTAWGDLRASLPSNPNDGFLLGTSDSKLLLDGAPLEGAGLAERGFADFLTAAGISSLFFSGKTTIDDFNRLIHAFVGTGMKAAAMGEHLRKSLADSNIKINEIRYVATDADSIADTFSLQLTARALGADAEKLREWLHNPQKLLQLIAASEGVDRKMLHGDSAGAEAPLQEDDVNNVLRMLASLGKAVAAADPASIEAAQNEIVQSPIAAQAALRQALASISAEQPDSADPELLVKAAEHLAIKFALERYERGEVRVDAVREMLDRMGQQLETLRKVLRAHEDKMARAGMLVESHVDILDRQFWSTVPGPAKRKVLQSADAWCIPPRNIRTFIAELQARGDEDLAAGILKNYSRCVHAGEVEARQKTAQGLTQLADLYGACGRGLLLEAIKLTGEQLSEETGHDLQTVLSAAFVRLSHEAAASHDYPALKQAVNCVEKITHSRPDFGQDLSRRIGISARLPKLLSEALQRSELSPALIEFLGADPVSAVRELAAQYSRLQNRNDCDRLVELARRLGPAASQSLVDTLRSRPAPEAITTIGLLSHLDLDAVRNLLPTRMKQWGRAVHDDVVCQVAAAGVAGRGGVLLELLEVLHPSVLPRVLDEIAFSGDPCALPRLLHIAEGGLPDTASPLLQVKAIEALACLKNAGAAPVLHELVEGRALLGWKYPREVRIVAAQALLRIDDEFRRQISQTGLADYELEISPLDPVPDTTWLRQRRYRRIAPAHTIKGAISTPKGKCGVLLNLLSLGGGQGLREGRIQPGSEGDFDLQWGLRRLHSRVVVRSVGPHDVAFEITDIGLDERWKLRRLLADQMRYNPIMATPGMTSGPLPPPASA